MDMLSSSIKSESSKFFYRPQFTPNTLKYTKLGFPVLRRGCDVTSATIPSFSAVSLTFPYVFGTKICIYKIVSTLQLQEYTKRRL